MIGAPAVSVVVPLYNKEKYIQRCLVSIQQQTVPDFEVLIVDDGSKDGSAVVVEPWLIDKRFRLIRQLNAGEGAARNRGLQEAKGALVAFLDADDEWLPGHLQSIVDLGRFFPTAVFFATGYQTKYKRDFNVLRSINRLAPCLIDDYFQLASTGHAVHVSAAAIRRSPLISTVRFNECAAVNEDEEYYVRLAIIGPMAFDPSITAIYHCDVTGNVMSTAVWQMGLKAAPHLLVEYLTEGKIPSAMRGSAESYLAWLIWNQALAGIVAGRKPAALSLLQNTSCLENRYLKRLDHVRTILRWIPEFVLRFVIQLVQSRWGLVLEQIFSIYKYGIGSPKACSRIECRSSISERR
jgi:hypothetical protein